MKPYPMRACAGGCNQGRERCKTEAACTLDLHRVTPPATAESRDLPITMEDEPADLIYALLIVVAAFVVGIVALPFLLEYLGSMK